jgi:hypothetical protein
MRNRGLFSVALEDESTGGEGGEAGDDVVLLTPGEGAETEVETTKLTDEVEVTADEIGDITGTIDNGVNWVDKLMEVGDSLDKSAIAGIGIDEISIEPTMIAVEALCVKLGLEEMFVIPALESFQNPSTRIISTHIVVEKIGETVKKGKDAIVRMFKALLEKIKELGKKLMEILTNTFPMHIKSLEKRIDALKDDNSAMEIKDKGLVRAFGKKGQAKVTVADVEKVLTFPADVNAVAEKTLGSEVGSSSSNDHLIFDSVLKDGRIVEGAGEVSDSASIEVANKGQMKVSLGLIRKYVELAKGMKKAIDKAEGNIKKATSATDDADLKEAFADASKMVSLQGQIVKLYSITAKEGLKYLERCVTARKGGKKEDDKKEEGTKEEPKK